MPTLKARLLLDHTGRPQFSDVGGKRHYWIALSVADAKAASSVTYKLHETFWDPVREAFDRDKDFAEQITTYGDFDVVASLSGSVDAGLTLKGTLSALLSASHPEAHGDVAAAIEDIARS
jgi:hypothetical protein